MGWHIVGRDAFGRIEVALDNPVVDIVDVLDYGLETGSTATGRNAITGELEVYWFTKSPLGVTEKGSWDKL